jgi:beta-lactamase class A
MRLFLLALLASTLAHAQSTAIELLEQRTTARLRAVGPHVEGVIGVAAIDLKSGRMLVYNPLAILPQASCIKIAILVEMFRAAKAGKFHLDDKITLQPNESVEGSGHLQIQLRNGPVQLTIRQLVTAMIEASDNTATNRCIALVGMQRVNQTMAELGLRDIRLNRVMLDSAAAARDEENIAPATQMARLAELIYRGKAVDADASHQMIEIMKLVDGDVRKTVPGNIPVASKVGELPGVRAETAIVYLPRRPYILSVAASFLRPGSNPIPEVAAIVHEHFAQLDAANSYGRKLQ